MYQNITIYKFSTITFQKPVLPLPSDIMKQKLLTLTVILLITIPAFSQTTHYSRLEIKEKEVFEVGPGNTLIVDTLIMYNKSTIRFSPDTLGVLKAKVVRIGKSCLITAKGEDGIDYRLKAYSTLREHGSPGQNGGDLDIQLQIEKLGSLTIDTRGGKGGDGLKGRNGKKGIPERKEKKRVIGANGKYITVNEVIPGVPGTDGTNASTGFHGGNGGNIDLAYSASNLIPVFNNSKARNSITLLYRGGSPGKDGKPGIGGIDSNDGDLITLEKKESVDGEIKLTNLKASSVLK